MTYSATTGPRASCVRPPRDCATGCARVLKCVWMKQYHPFFLYRLWNHFSLLLLFKGVGSRGVTMRMRCFIFKFLGGGGS